MSFDLSGKIALVTGGSRGIGQAICRQLALNGAHVIISSRNIESCDILKDELLSAGHSAESYASDTGDVGQIIQLMSYIEATHNRLDVLVNNSAANPWFGPVMKLELEAYQKTVDVNLRGTLFASIEAAKLMKDTGGSIVNTGSINAVKPVVGQGIYSITKGALETMTRSLAKEWGPLGIRVNLIAPGITRTDSIEHVFQGKDSLPEKWLSQIPLGRHAMPVDMAGAVAFLASDAAKYITGANLTIDGGLTL